MISEWIRRTEEEEPDPEDGEYELQPGEFIITSPASIARQTVRHAMAMVEGGRMQGTNIRAVAAQPVAVHSNRQVGGASEGWDSRSRSRTPSETIEGTGFDSGQEAQVDDASVAPTIDSGTSADSVAIHLEERLD